MGFVRKRRVKKDPNRPNYQLLFRNSSSEDEKEPEKYDVDTNDPEEDGNEDETIRKNENVHAHDEESEGGCCIRDREFNVNPKRKIDKKGFLKWKSRMQVCFFNSISVGYNCSRRQRKTDSLVNDIVSTVQFNISINILVAMNLDCISQYY